MKTKITKNKPLQDFILHSEYGKVTLDQENIRICVKISYHTRYHEKSRTAPALRFSYYVNIQEQREDNIDNGSINISNKMFTFNF